MNKNISIFFVIFFVIFLIMTNAYAIEQYIKSGYGKVVFFEQRLTIEVELATTKKQRATGLMFRDYLAPDKGMLFVFEEETIQKVWMKDTLISLDIVFVSSEGEIVSIIKGLQPCTKKTCDIYDSTKSAKYMLEINAGVVDCNNIGIGQMLII